MKTRTVMVERATGREGPGQGQRDRDRGTETEGQGQSNRDMLQFGGL